VWPLEAAELPCRDASVRVTRPLARRLFFALGGGRPAARGRGRAQDARRCWSRSGTGRPAAWLMAGAFGDQRCGFLLRAVRIWERRHHGGGFDGGGDPPAELKAAVACSWAVAASYSGLRAELGRQCARFRDVREGGGLLETSVPHHVRLGSLNSFLHLQRPSRAITDYIPRITTISR
jgi:hypothetical protein